MDEEKRIRYFFWGIIAIIVILSYFILKEFLIALASAFILAYLLKPINDRLVKKMPIQLAAFLTILIVLIIILVIFFLIINSLINQLSEISGQKIIEGIKDNLNKLPYDEFVTKNLSEIISKLGEVFLKLVSEIITETPKKILTLFVTLFTTYYLLIDWDKLKKELSEILPFKNKHFVMERVETVIYDILVGTFILAVIETIIAIVGFWLLGIKLAVLLGFAIGVLAFIPALGPALVWVPLAIVEFSFGNYTAAIGVIVIGIILSSLIDGFLRIRLMKGKANIHPVIMLVGILGGVHFFGLIGFILGPLVLSILMTIVDNIPKIK